MFVQFGPQQRYGVKLQYLLHDTSLLKIRSALHNKRMFEAFQALKLLDISV